jgi:uroporphyrinogen-III synthase
LVGSLWGKSPQKSLPKLAVDMTMNDSETKLKPVKSILVTQPAPTDLKSPYFDLAKKYNIKIDFRPFIEVEGVNVSDFRKQKIDLLAHTAVIFTSRNAIDHFFRLATAMKVEMPPETKYFCISDQTSNYLQKYVVIRKRKVFSGIKTAVDLTEILKKHPKEKFLFPCSSIRKSDIPDFMQGQGYHFTEAVMYDTVASNLSDLSDVYYDMIAFFSPSGVSSLFTNFPDFQQKDTRIAAFGPTTAKAVLDYNLRLDVQAPMPNAPSMTGAIELYIRKANNIKD